MERTEAGAAPRGGKVVARYCPVRAVGWPWVTGEEPTARRRVAETAVTPEEAEGMPLWEAEEMPLREAGRMPPAEEATIPPVEGERIPPVQEEVQVAVMAGEMTV
jgi:hypothetical protein